MRAGAKALTLLSNPLNVQVLQALDNGPLGLTQLRRVVGSPPQSTMRKHLRGLTELGILERRQQTEFPGSVDFELQRPGIDLLVVAESLQVWLDRCPDAHLALGTAAAKSTIKALVDGWNSAILRALAARPMTLTELNRLISTLNYPSLERRLGALRLARLVEACAGGGRGTPCAPTMWLREGMAPLVMAAGWERTYAAEKTPPVGKLDVETALLLTVGVLRLPVELSGTCRFAVGVRGAAVDGYAGVLVGVRDGRVVSCVSKLQGEASAWASGSTRVWLDAVLSGEVEALEVGGDSELALSLIEALQAGSRGIRQVARSR